MRPMKHSKKIFEPINPLLYRYGHYYISVLDIARCVGGALKDIFKDKILKRRHLI